MHAQRRYRRDWCRERVLGICHLNRGGKDTRRARLCSQRRFGRSLFWESRVWRELFSVAVGPDDVLLFTIWSQDPVIAIVQAGESHRDGGLYWRYCRPCRLFWGFFIRYTAL